VLKTVPSNTSDRARFGPERIQRRFGVSKRLFYVETRRPYATHLCDSHEFERRTAGQIDDIPIEIPWNGKTP
jgi:hypothetical protein